MDKKQVPRTKGHIRASPPASYRAESFSRVPTRKRSASGHSNASQNVAPHSPQRACRWAWTPMVSPNSPGQGPFVWGPGQRHELQEPEHRVDPGVSESISLFVGDPEARAKKRRPVRRDISELKMVQHKSDGAARAVCVPLDLRNIDPRFINPSLSIWTGPLQQWSDSQTQKHSPDIPSLQLRATVGFLQKPLAMPGVRNVHALGQVHHATCAANTQTTFGGNCN